MKPQPTSTRFSQIAQDTAAAIKQMQREAANSIRRAGRAPRPRRAPEQDLQKAVAEFLALALTDPQTFWTAFPAGGGGKARGGQLKAMGLKAGVPDILVIDRSRALWIELKTQADKATNVRAGRHSDPQDVTQEALRMAGCWVITCRSVVEVENVLRSFKVPMTGRVMG